MSTAAVSAPDHAADEAGGEAVYSSDGLPPLPAPPAPISQLIPSSQPDDVVDSGDGLDPEAAFEVFSGRAFPSSVAVRSDLAAVPGAGAVETPLDKLARLTAEVSALEKDLAASASVVGADAAAEGGAVTDEELSRLARDLASRLEAAGNKHGKIPPGTSLFRGRQDDLTSLVRKELETARKRTDGVAEAPTKGEGDGRGVVYELYGSSAPGRDGPKSAEESNLEERMLRVEAMVGSASASPGSAGGKTILQRLEEAEKMAKRVDEKALESAAARAKVIRADLEAASKAKAKLSSSLSISSEDAKTISSLHDQMIELEGLTAALPAVVERLGQLSSLHSQSADFATRLTAAENAASDTEALLRGVEEALAKVEGGFNKNMAVVESSMAKLDERIASLPSSS